jgi:MFS family permease
MAPMEASPFELILRPLRDVNFRNLIRFLGPWNFAVNLAAPFFVVYMFKRLGLGMSSIMGLTVLSQLMNFAFLRIWGKLSDRFSNKSVLAVSGPLFMLCILAWTFTTLPGWYTLTVPLLLGIHVLTGISTAGVTLASGNIGLKLAPRGEATSYLVASNIVNSLAAGFAPILGGRLADFFAKRELMWTVIWRGPGGEFTQPTLDLRQWDFVFFIAVAIGLYSLHRLALVKEVGEVKERIVIRELIAESWMRLRNLSTASGLRQMVQIPLLLFKQLAGKGPDEEGEMPENPDMSDAGPDGSE